MGQRCVGKWANMWTSRIEVNQIQCPTATTVVTLNTFSRWRLSGRPTFCIVVTENNMRDPQFLSMLTALAEFRTGMVNGVKVNVGRVQGHPTKTRDHINLELQCVLRTDDQSC